MSTKEGDFGKDAAILKELREISNKHSPYNGSTGNTTTSKEAEEPNKRPRLALSSSDALSEKENSSQVNDGTNNEFLHQTGENRNLNQYWYSKNTIEVLCSAIREALSISKGSRVAFLSTPSLFFSLSSKERENCALFDVSSEGGLPFA
jgi:hypothetical protein